MPILISNKIVTEDLAIKSKTNYKPIVVRSIQNKDKKRKKGRLHKINKIKTENASLKNELEEIKSQLKIFQGFVEKLTRKEVMSENTTEKFLKSNATRKTSQQEKVSSLKNVQVIPSHCGNAKEDIKTGLFEKKEDSSASQPKINHKKKCDFMDLDFKANLQKYYN